MMRSREKLSQALISGLHQCCLSPHHHQPSCGTIPHSLERKRGPHTPGRSGRRTARGGTSQLSAVSEVRFPPLRASLWPTSGSRKVSPALPLPQGILPASATQYCQHALSPSSPGSPFSFPAPGRVKSSLWWLGRNLGASGGLDPDSDLSGALSAPITQQAQDRKGPAKCLGTVPRLRT